MGLNWQLTERGARRVARVETAAEYRLYALPGGAVERPGLSRDPGQGRAVPGEVWRVPAENFGSFVAGIPGPLGIGRVLLADGSEVSGFICEAYGLAGAHEIRRGGWREYCAGAA
jgi:allophanate hydrolase